MGGQRTVVIGAGIAGVCCAAALQQDGHTVALIDRDGPGQACSFGNAGQFNTGSSLPIAMPGMLSQVPRWLLDPLGPLSVRWQYVPKALPWLIRWIKAGQNDRVPGLSAALRALHRDCLEIYRQWLGEAGVADLLRTTGHLHVWEKPEPSALDVFSRSLRAASGIRSRVLDSAEIRAMEPSLAPIFRRGLFFPDNGHTVNPQRLVQTLAERIVRAGGVLHRSEVTGFQREGAKVTAVHTTGQSLPCDAVVIAAGAWSRKLTEQLGTRLPLETERGYHAMLPSPGITLRVPVSIADHAFVMTPMEHGLRLAGTVEIGGLDARPNYRRSEILVRQATRIVPGLATEGAQYWMGYRPSFPDSLPVIDRATAAPNAYLAFGHGHTGLSGSPMTGKLVADMVAGREPSIDSAPFRADRF